MKKVHQNSIESYYGVNLSQRQTEVVSALIALGRATDEQIAKQLGYTVNRVTGRIAELIEMGLVHEVGSVIGNFGKQVRVCEVKKKDTLF